MKHLSIMACAASCLAMSASAASATNPTRVATFDPESGGLSNIDDGFGARLTGSASITDPRGDNGIGWPDGTKSTTISDGMGARLTGSGHLRSANPSAAALALHAEPLSIAAAGSVTQSG